jgi:2-iminoacetate synthase
MQKADFIDHARIEDILKAAARTTPEKAGDILKKAAEAKGLSPEEAAALLYVQDPNLLEEMYSTAAAVKERIYGRRVVLFAPLYLSNYCVNNCLYCGYRQDHQFARRRLTMRDIAAEVTALEEMGHKRWPWSAGKTR